MSSAISGLLSRFSRHWSLRRFPAEGSSWKACRPRSEICEMVGITLEDFTQSRSYQEIFGLGEARGKALGEAKVTLRLLARRCANS